MGSLLAALQSVATPVSELGIVQQDASTSNAPLWPTAETIAWRYNVADTCCEVLAGCVRTQAQQNHILSGLTSPTGGTGGVDTLNALVGLLDCGYAKVFKIRQLQGVCAHDMLGLRGRSSGDLCACS